MGDTEETLRENIEGQQLEAVITNLMTTQLGVDLEDLYLNGDEKASQVKEFNSSDTFAIGDIVTNNKKLYKFIKAHTAGAWNASEAIEIGAAADADFLKLNDGWIKSDQRRRSCI